MYLLGAHSVLIIADVISIVIIIVVVLLRVGCLAALLASLALL
jgi:hypothetical protein